LRKELAMRVDDIVSSWQIVGCGDNFFITGEPHGLIALLPTCTHM